MTNARKEMLKLLKGREIKCAKVTTGIDCYEEDECKTIVLKVGHDGSNCTKVNKK